MYSLDINFLKDRSARPTEVAPGPRRPTDSQTPLYVGAAVGVLLPLLMGGLWFFLQSRNADLERQQAELDSQLTAIQAQLQEVETIRAEVAQIDLENRALATVFDRIKPWSAILQDVRDRVPAGVQIVSIVQTPPVAAAPVAAPPPDPAASPDPNQPPPAVPEPEPSKIEISGISQSFDSVNDFMLTLQRSPFLDSETTRLVRAELVPDPTRVDIETEGQQNARVEVQLTDVVQYTIESSLTPIPTTDLLQDLERTLAVGMAARIQALRDKGVIQP